MEITLSYGDSQRSLVLPDNAEVAWLSPTGMPVIKEPEKALRTALNEPLDALPLEARPAPFTAAIAVPDETRPAQVKTLLPVVLERLFKAYPQLDPDNVLILVAGGLHPPLDHSGLERVVPESIRRGCRVLPHDARSSTVFRLGVTSRGTPVEINAEYAKADLKLVLGLIDPHQFVGFTGGAKGVVIGAGSVPAVEHNHSLMFHEQAQVGILDGNPVREDINEAGRIIGVDLAVNVVLDGSKRIVRLLAGDPETVLRHGAATCARVYGVEIDQPFDLVIASCGGHPKDICLYQAQKGLNMASTAVKPGGRLLLLAACPQGIGDDIYLDYASRFATPEEVLKDFEKNGFRVGAHKAYLFGRTLVQYDVAVASELDAEILSRCHLAKADPQKMLDRWLSDLAGNPRIGIVPNANTTFFRRKATRHPKLRRTANC